MLVGRGRRIRSFRPASDTLVNVRPTCATKDVESIKVIIVIIL